MCHLLKETKNIDKLIKIFKVIFNMLHFLTLNKLKSMLGNSYWLVWLLNGQWRSSETLKDHKTKVWECVAKTNMKYTLNEENISASTNIKEKTQSKLQWSCSEARRDDDDGDDDDDDDEEEEEEEEWRWWCRWYSSVSECSSFEWPSSSGRINSGTSVKSKRASI